MTWSTRDRAIILGYVDSCPSKADAARELGVNWSTLWRWLNTDHAPSSPMLREAILRRCQEIAQPKTAETRKKNR